MENIKFRYEYYDVVVLKKDNIGDVKEKFSKTKIDIIDYVENGEIVGVSVNTIGGYEVARFGDLVARKQNYGMAKIYKLNILKAITAKAIVCRIDEIKNALDFSSVDRGLRFELIQEKKALEKYLNQEYQTILNDMYSFKVSEEQAKSLARQFKLN